MRTTHLTRGLGMALGMALALSFAGCAHEGQTAGAAGVGGQDGEAVTRPAGDEAGAAGAADVDAGYGPHNLDDPSGAAMNETAPDVYRARFETTAGTLQIEVTRAWAPHGADRFYNLVRNGFFDDTYFFRAIPGFMAQFGLPADPAVGSAWAGATIPDDPPAGKSNTPYMVTFAKTGAPNSRSTQLFINFADNSGLDRQGFTPIGQVVEGRQAVDAIHTGYGESQPRGQGPTQDDIRRLGSTFLAEKYPKLTRIERAVIVRD